MYVAPDTDVRLLTGIKLDPEHVNTIWWSTLERQTSYFINKTKYSFTDQTYQRVTKGVMRIGRPVADLFDCNYMMFRNTGFGNKWFYAFIDNVEYINNAVTEIKYTIDPLQTWYFEYSLNANAYVEREHSRTDVIGENIIPEPVEVGEYVPNNDGIGNYTRSFDMNDLAVIVAVCDTEGSAVSGKLYDRIYGGATLKAFHNTDVNGINTYLATFIRRPDAVLSIYMVPEVFLNVNVQTGGTDVPSGLSGGLVQYQADTLTTSAKLDGYSPRNRKLYTYPYNFWQIDNSEGQTLALRYEWCPNRTPTMEFYATITNPVSVVGKPNMYGGISQNLLNNYMSIEMSNFPMCSWNSDAFKAWLAQNSIPLGLSAVSQIASTAIGASLIGSSKYTLASTELSGVGAVAQILEQAYKASIAADICKGQINNGGANITRTKKQFYSGRFSVQYGVARQLDDFFDMFGYATNLVKSPNINSRPQWNYVKTIEMCGDGLLPSDDSKLIDSYFNKGIRFWNYGDNIGDYSLNNRPT